MRRPERLDYFYEEMKNLHKDHFPDWREGQFLINFLEWVTVKKKKDPFYLETEEILMLLRDFIEVMKG